MTEKEKMLSSRLYIQDQYLKKDFLRAKEVTRLFNNSKENELDYRRSLLNKLFNSVGQNINIEPPFHCDYGYNTNIGNNFYANYDCIILDVCNVSIGDNVFFGPRVGIYTAGHPIDADIRNENLEYGKEIKIGNNVWIGANAIINPGVTIGENVVIGSGSIVTKDIPNNVIAVGNPCKILREITLEDKKYWEEKRKEYYTTK